MKTTRDQEVIIISSASEAGFIVGICALLKNIEKSYTIKKLVLKVVVIHLMLADPNTRPRTLNTQFELTQD